MAKTKTAKTSKQRTKTVKEKKEDTVLATTKEVVAETKAEKKRGRRPMSDAEKAIAAKKRAIEKEKEANLVPSIVFQYKGKEALDKDLIAQAKELFKMSHKRTPITSLELYVKPEDGLVYFVVNGVHYGQIDF